MIKLDNIEEKIIKEKKYLRNKSKNYKDNFVKIQKFIEKEILDIEELKKNNFNVIPEVSFHELTTHPKK